MYIGRADTRHQALVLAHVAEAGSITFQVMFLALAPVRPVASLLSSLRPRLFVSIPVVLGLTAGIVSEEPA